MIDPPRPDAPEVDLPESLSYRIKNRLLGPPLVTEQLRSEKLGKAMALGVLSSDCISSSAYGTEEILLVLVKAVGLAAFSLLIPITIVVLVVLAFVTMSYLEVVQVYTKAGGAYSVAKDNFGLNVAQIAGVALIIDYTVTVAVQTAAGTDALASAFSVLTPYKLVITLVAVLLLAYGNLRGIREAGRIFAFPTYFFIGSMGLVIVVGLIREAMGQLHYRSLTTPGIVPLGHSGQGLLLGASLFVALQAFANGGSSLTGLEAVSNGVSAIKDPAGQNAKKVMLGMSITLGSLVMGVSWLAHVTHSIPFTAGSPTVISQEAKAVFGSGPAGTTLFLIVQAATMLILFTGANTSFNGFPFLTSFVATDSFLPRQLSRRGHRLAFSNGIIVLTVVSMVLLLVTRAKVDKLVSLYAIGVFTGFTMAGAGMVKHHLTRREPHWRRKVFVNGSASVLSALIVLIFAVVKFTEGAWIVVVLGPILVYTFIRLHRQYEVEEAELEEGAPRATEVAILKRHVVMVMVEKLDLASARAIQYARTLQPDELHAVHFILDDKAARHLGQEWANLGLSERFTLELEECPDRRIGRATLQKVAGYVAGGETEVSVLLPRRAYTRTWSRFLHDRTADRIAAVVSQLPHANAT
ncbi:MAG: APC family permease, partial [Acidimicrobiales bacterium]